MKPALLYPDGTPNGKFQIEDVPKPEIGAGESAIIFGDGPIALMTAQMIGKIASKGVLVGVIPQRLKTAEEIKVDLALNSTEPGYQNKLRSLVPGGADVVIEASGNPIVPQIALENCTRGGTIVQVGVLPAFILGISICSWKYLFRLFIRFCRVDYPNFKIALPFP